MWLNVDAFAFPPILKVCFAGFEPVVASPKCSFGRDGNEGLASPILPDLLFPPSPEGSEGDSAFFVFPPILKPFSFPLCSWGDSAFGGKEGGVWARDFRGRGLSVVVDKSCKGNLLCRV